MPVDSNKERDKGTDFSLTLSLYSIPRNKTLCTITWNWKVDRKEKSKTDTTWYKKIFSFVNQTGKKNDLIFYKWKIKN